MLSDHSILRLAEDVTYQSMGQDEETVILSLKSGALYTCNETSADFLAVVDGVKTFGEIVDKLEEIYEVSRGKLYSDLRSLANRMIDEQLLVISG